MDTDNNLLYLISTEKKLMVILILTLSGYPNEAAAHVALRTTREWLDKHTDEVSLSHFEFPIFLSSCQDSPSLSRCLLTSLLSPGGQNHLLCILEGGSENLQRTAPLLLPG